MKVVIVTGSRNYPDNGLVEACLDDMYPDLVVEGGCPTGADYFAKRWSEINDVSHLQVPADWDKHGRSAGPKRNRKMLKLYPDATVLAFPMVGSRGTVDCIRQAREMNMEVVVK